MSDPIECEVHNCDDKYADFIFYPDQRRKVEVATYLCTWHRSVAIRTAKAQGHQNHYAAANQLIRQSLA